MTERLRVLALLAQAPAEVLAQTVTHALARGTDDPAAIALLLRQHGESYTPQRIATHLLPEAARVLPPVIDLTAYATAKLMEVAA